MADDLFLSDERIREAEALEFMNSSNSFISGIEFERDSEDQIDRIRQSQVDLADTDSRYNEVQKLSGGAGRPPVRDDWATRPGVSPGLTEPDAQAMDYRIPEFGADGYMRTPEPLGLATPGPGPQPLGVDPAGAGGTLDPLTGRPAYDPYGEGLAAPDVNDPNFAAMQQDYYRRAAIARGIDPDILDRVVSSEGGYASPNRQSNAFNPYINARERSFGPLQLNIDGGVGESALQRGLDPRDPNQWREVADFALDQVVAQGWGPWRGAEKQGITGRIGIDPSRADPSMAPPRVAQAPTRDDWSQYGAKGMLTPGDDRPSQFGVGLSNAQAMAACGPVLAMAFAQKFGRNPTAEEATDLATKFGWNTEQGMAGPESQVNLMRAMGVPASLEKVDKQRIIQDIRNGNMVGIDTEGHYFSIEDYDPQTDRFDFGTSATDLRRSGGERWFRLEDLGNLGMGTARTAIHVDNPSTAGPSVAVTDLREGGRTPPPAGQFVPDELRSTLQALGFDDLDFGETRYYKRSGNDVAETFDEPEQSEDTIQAQQRLSDEDETEAGPRTNAGTSGSSDDDYGAGAWGASGSDAPDPVIQDPVAEAEAMGRGRSDGREIVPTEQAALQDAPDGPPAPPEAIEAPGASPDAAQAPTLTQTALEILGGAKDAVVQKAGEIKDAVVEKAGQVGGALDQVTDADYQRAVKAAQNKALADPRVTQIKHGSEEQRRLVAEYLPEQFRDRWLGLEDRRRADPTKPYDPYGEGLAPPDVQEGHPVARAAEMTGNKLLEQFVGSIGSGIMAFGESGSDTVLGPAIRGLGRSLRDWSEAKARDNADDYDAEEARWGLGKVAATNNPVETVKKFAELAANPEAHPYLVATIGPSVAQNLIEAVGVGLLTRVNPRAGLALGADMLAQMTGEAYDEAVKQGVGPQQAARLASVIGPINTAIEFMPWDDLAPFLKGGSVEGVKESLGRAIFGTVKEMGIDAITEAGEEGLQTIVSNLAERTYNSSKGIFDDITMGLIGAAIGGGVGSTTMKAPQIVNRISTAATDGGRQQDNSTRAAANARTNVQARDVSTNQEIPQAAETDETRKPVADTTTVAHPAFTYETVDMPGDKVGVARIGEDGRRKVMDARFEDQEEADAYIEALQARQAARTPSRAPAAATAVERPAEREAAATAPSAGDRSMPFDSNLPDDFRFEQRNLGGEQMYRVLDHNGEPVARSFSRTREDAVDMMNRRLAQRRARYGLDRERPPEARPAEGDEQAALPPGDESAAFSRADLPRVGIRRAGGIANAERAYEPGTPEHAFEQLAREDATNAPDGQAHLSAEQMRAIPGAPKGKNWTIAALDDYRKVVEVGMEHKDWYETVADRAVQEVGEENLDEFFTIAAITSQSNSWPNNIASTFNVMRQVRELWEGGRWSRKDFDGLRFAIGTGEQKDKLWELYSSGAVNLRGGSTKTPTFRTNFISAGRREYNPLSTQDMLMGRLFGVPMGKDQTMTGDIKGTRFGHAVFDWIAREKGITPQQAQATGWVMAQILSTKKGREYLDRWRENPDTYSLSQAMDDLVSSGAVDALTADDTGLGVWDRKQIVTAAGNYKQWANVPRPGHKGDFSYTTEGTFDQKSIPPLPINPQEIAKGRVRAESQAPLVGLPVTRAELEAEGLNKRGRFLEIKAPHRVVQDQDGSSYLLLPGGNTDTAAYYAAHFGDRFKLPSNTYQVVDPNADEIVGVRFRKADGAKFSGVQVARIKAAFGRYKIPVIESGDMLRIALLRTDNATWENVEEASRAAGFDDDELREIMDAYRGQNVTINRTSYAGTLEALGDRFSAPGRPYLRRRAAAAAQKARARQEQGHAEAAQDREAVRLENQPPEERAAFLVAEEVATELPHPIEMPATPQFTEAVANTPGAEITPEGLLKLDLTRWQKPDQEGEYSVRSGVFYLVAANKARQRAYRLKSSDPVVQKLKEDHGTHGGTQNIKGPSYFRRPFVVKAGQGGALGEKAFNELWSRENDEQAFRKAALKRLNKEQDDLAEEWSKVTMPDRADPDRQAEVRKRLQNIRERIREAKLKPYERLMEDVDRAASPLGRWGYSAKKDPSEVVDDLAPVLEAWGVVDEGDRTGQRAARWFAEQIAYNANRGNQARFAAAELITAYAARDAGYDAILAISDGWRSSTPTFGEVFDLREQTYPDTSGRTQLHGGRSSQPFDEDGVSFSRSSDRLAKLQDAMEREGVRVDEQRLTTIGADSLIAWLDPNGTLYEMPRSAAGGIFDHMPRGEKLDDFYAPGAADRLLMGMGLVRVVKQGPMFTLHADLGERISQAQADTLVRLGTAQDANTDGYFSWAAPQRSGSTATSLKRALPTLVDQGASFARQKPEVYQNGTFDRALQRAWKEGLVPQAMGANTWVVQSGENQYTVVRNAPEDYTDNCQAGLNGILCKHVAAVMHQERDYPGAPKDESASFARSQMPTARPDVEGNLSAVRKEAAKGGQTFARALAERYATEKLGRKNGLPEIRKIQPDPKLQETLARWGLEQGDKSDDPEVIDAFKPSVKEIHDQFWFAVANGVVFEPFGAEGQPYRGSDPYRQYAQRWNTAHAEQITAGVEKKLEPSQVMRMDVGGRFDWSGGKMRLRPEGEPSSAPHLWVYDEHENQTTDWWDAETNWKFRAIHDLFGHAAGANSFGPGGEVNAAMEHSRMFTPEAWQPLTMELQWQNSYTNYLPGHMDKPIAERPFAPGYKNVPPQALTRRPDAFPGVFQARIGAAADQIQNLEVGDLAAQIERAFPQFQEGLARSGVELLASSIGQGDVGQGAWDKFYGDNNARKAAKAADPTTQSLDSERDFNLVVRGTKQQIEWLAAWLGKHGDARDDQGNLLKEQGEVIVSYEDADATLPAVSLSIDNVSMGSDLLQVMEEVIDTVGGWHLAFTPDRQAVELYSAARYIEGDQPTKYRLLRERIDYLRHTLTKYGMGSQEPRYYTVELISYKRGEYDPVIERGPGEPEEARGVPSGSDRGTDRAGAGALPAVAGQGSPTDGAGPRAPAGRAGPGRPAHSTDRGAQEAVGRAKLAEAARLGNRLLKGERLGLPDGASAGWSFSRRKPSTGDRVETARWKLDQARARAELARIKAEGFEALGDGKSMALALADERKQRQRIVDLAEVAYPDEAAAFSLEAQERTLTYEFDQATHDTAVAFMRDMPGFFDETTPSAVLEDKQAVFIDRDGQMWAVGSHEGNALVLVQETGLPGSDDPGRALRTLTEKAGLIRLRNWGDTLAIEIGAAVTWPQRMAITRLYPHKFGSVTWEIHGFKNGYSWREFNQVWPMDEPEKPAFAEDAGWGPDLDEFLDYVSKPIVPQRSEWVRVERDYGETWRTTIDGENYYINGDEQYGYYAYYRDPEGLEGPNDQIGNFRGEGALENAQRAAEQWANQPATITTRGKMRWTQRGTIEEGYMRLMARHPEGKGSYEITQQGKGTDKWEVTYTDEDWNRTLVGLAAPTELAAEDQVIQHVEANDLWAPEWKTVPDARDWEHSRRLRGEESWRFDATEGRYEIVKEGALVKMLFNGQRILEDKEVYNEDEAVRAIYSHSISTKPSVYSGIKGINANAWATNKAWHIDPVDPTDPEVGYSVTFNDQDGVGWHQPYGPYRTLNEAMKQVYHLASNNRLPAGVPFTYVPKPVAGALPPITSGSFAVGPGGLQWVDDDGNGEGYNAKGLGGRTYSITQQRDADQQEYWEITGTGLDKGRVNSLNEARWFLQQVEDQASGLGVFRPLPTDRWDAYVAEIQRDAERRAKRARKGKKDEFGATVINTAQGISDEAKKKAARSEYNGDFGRLGTKELIQNAVDNLRSLNRRSGRVGNVRAVVNGKQRRIEVTDSGTGITPEVATTAFVNLRESAKDAEGPQSGGKGTAKMLFLGSAKDVRMMSVSRTAKGKPQVVVVFGTDDEYLKSEVGLRQVHLTSGDTWDKARQHPEIRAVIPETWFRDWPRDAKGELETGTRIVVSPVDDMDWNTYDSTNYPRPDKKWIYDFLLGSRDSVLETFEPYFVLDGVPISPPRQGGTAARTSLGKVKVLQENGEPFGDVEIEFFVSDDAKEAYGADVQMLNNGLFQEQASVSLREPIVMPVRILADIQTKMDPNERGYPWKNDRTAVLDPVKETIDRYVKGVLAGQAAQKETQALIDAIRNSPSILGTPFKLIDPTGQFGDFAVRTANRRYARLLAEALNEGYAVIRGRVGPPPPDSEAADAYEAVSVRPPDSTFMGLYTTPKQYGVNVGGGDKLGLPTSYMVMTNPWLSLKQANAMRMGQQHRGQVLSPEQKRRILGNWLTKTIIHEYAHNWERSHGPDHNHRMGEIDALVTEIDDLRSIIQAGLSLLSDDDWRDLEDDALEYELRADSLGNNFKDIFKKNAVDETGTEMEYVDRSRPRDSARARPASPDAQSPANLYATGAEAGTGRPGAVRGGPQTGTGRDAGLERSGRVDPAGRRAAPVAGPTGRGEDAARSVSQVEIPRDAAEAERAMVTRLTDAVARDAGTLIPGTRSRFYPERYLLSDALHARMGSATYIKTVVQAAERADEILRQIHEGETFGERTFKPGQFVGVSNQAGWWGALGWYGVNLPGSPNWTGKGQYTWLINPWTIAKDAQRQVLRRTPGLAPKAQAAAVRTRIAEMLAENFIHEYVHNAVREEKGDHTVLSEIIERRLGGQIQRVANNAMAAVNDETLAQWLQDTSDWVVAVGNAQEEARRGDDVRSVPDRGPDGLRHPPYSRRRAARDRAGLRGTGQAERGGPPGGLGRGDPGLPGFQRAESSGSDPAADLVISVGEHTSFDAAFRAAYERWAGASVESLQGDLQTFYRQVERDIAEGIDSLASAWVHLSNEQLNDQDGADTDLKSAAAAALMEIYEQDGASTAARSAEAATILAAVHMHTERGPLIVSWLNPETGEANETPIWGVDEALDARSDRLDRARRTPIGALNPEYVDQQAQERTRAQARRDATRPEAANRARVAQREQVSADQREWFDSWAEEHREVLPDAFAYLTATRQVDQAISDAMLRDAADWVVGQHQKGFITHGEKLRLLYRAKLQAAERNLDEGYVDQHLSEGMAEDAAMFQQAAPATDNPTHDRAVDWLIERAESDREMRDDLMESFGSQVVMTASEAADHITSPHSWPSFWIDKHGRVIASHPHHETSLNMIYQGIVEERERGTTESVIQDTGLVRLTTGGGYGIQIGATVTTAQARTIGTLARAIDADYYDPRGGSRLNWELSLPNQTGHGRGWRELNRVLPREDEAKPLSEVAEQAAFARLSSPKRHRFDPKVAEEIRTRLTDKYPLASVDEIVDRKTHTSAWITRDGKLVKVETHIQSAADGYGQMDTVNGWAVTVDGYNSDEYYHFVDRVNEEAGLVRVSYFNSYGGTDMTAIDVGAPLSEPQLRMLKALADASGTFEFNIKGRVVNIGWREFIRVRPTEWEDEAYGTEAQPEPEIEMPSFSRAASKPFYSLLERVVRTKLPGRGQAAQMKATLLNNGVKPEEMFWNGVEEFLDQRGSDTVTKAEIEQTIAENRVTINEHVRTTDGRDSSQLEEDYDSLLESAAYELAGEDPEFDLQTHKAYAFLSDLLADPGSYSFDGFSEDMAERIAELQDLKEQIENARNASDQARYDDPTLKLPGGENYTELLLQLQTHPDTGENAWLEWLRTEHGLGVMDFATLPYTRRTALLKKWKTDRPEPYQSGHWDEPNVLLHVRFDERVDASGQKVLFVEEIQSDWHQEGRKHGYKHTPTAKDRERIEELKVRMDAISAQIDAVDRQVSDLNAKYPERNRYFIDPTSPYAIEQQPLQDERTKLALEHSDLYKEYRQISGEAGFVPDAPFKKTWHELALKRMIRWAAENHFDSVAWTTGDQQGDRNTNDMFTEEGNNERRRGLSGFYDKMLVDAANKIAKRFGSRVGQAEIEVERVTPPLRADGRPGRIKGDYTRNATVHSLPITDSMRDSVLNDGQALFQREGYTSDAQRLSNDNTPELTDAEVERIRNEIKADAEQALRKGEVRGMRAAIAKGVLSAEPTALAAEQLRAAFQMSPQPFLPGFFAPAARQGLGVSPQVAGALPPPFNPQQAQREPNRWDVLNEIRVPGMLSGFHQVAQQILGNVAMVIPIMSIKYARGVGGAIRRGSTTELIHNATLTNERMAAIEALRDLVPNLIAVALDKDRPYNAGPGGIPLHKTRLKDPSGGKARAAWHFLKLMNAGSRLLVETGDVLFYVPWYRAALRREAARLASEKGLSGAAWHQEVNRLVATKPKALDDLARRFADRMTLKNALEKRSTDPRTGRPSSTRTFLGKGEAVRDLEINGVQVGMWIVPFARTIANSFARGIDLTPLGFIGSLADGYRAVRRGTGPYAQRRAPGALPMPGLANQRPFGESYDEATLDLDERLMLNMFGSAMMFWAMGQVLAGAITGDGPPEEEDRKKLEADGWRPNSFRVGDMYLPLRVLGPLAIPLSATAAIVENVGMFGNEALYRSDQADQNTLGARWWRAAQDWIKVFSNNTYLGDLQDFMGILGSNEPSAFSKGLRSMQFLASGMAGSVLPLSGTLGSIGRAKDEYVRTVDPARSIEDLPRAVGQSLQSRQPVLREDLAARQDAVGRPVANANQGAGVLLTPGLSKANDGIGRAFLKADVDFHEPPPSLSVGTDLRVKLDKDDQREWQREYGQMLLTLWRNAGASDGSAPSDPVLFEEFRKIAKEVADARMIGSLASRGRLQGNLEVNTGKSWSPVR
jgi:hypothetical protein